MCSDCTNHEQPARAAEQKIVWNFLREEATEIAKDNNYFMIYSVLTSEDLW